MPQAVLHILVPLILLSLFKDWYDSKKGKKIFPLKYVLIAGIAGVLPDIDIPIFWILHFFGFTLDLVHRTFTHTIFLPIILLILFFITSKKAEVKVGRNKLGLNIIFLMIFIGSSIHLILDATFQGYIVPLYPFIYTQIGLNLTQYLTEPLDNLFLPSLEGALLVLWIIYLEYKHKISDFI